MKYTNNHDIILMKFELETILCDKVGSSANKVVQIHRKATLARSLNQVVPSAYLRLESRGPLGKNSAVKAFESLGAGKSKFSSVSTTGLNLGFESPFPNKLPEDRTSESERYLVDIHLICVVFCRSLPEH